MKKFIVLATAAAFLASAGVASAYSFSWKTTTLSVTNLNIADVMNTVGTLASTGDNSTAAGSAWNTVSGKKGTNGGNSAVGGMGGTIDTGNALATTLVTNEVGYNKTVIDLCGCSSSPFSKTEVDVMSSNVAAIDNVVMTSASTGGNNTVGGDAGNSVTNTSWWWFGNTSSNGGNAAVAGMGGTIDTGNADAGSGVTNIVGSNITRIR